MITKEQFEYRKFVGERIKEKRKSLHWSQGRLGDFMGAKTSTVSSWELGANPIDTDKLLALSTITNTPISYFLDDDRQMEMKGEREALFTKWMRLSRAEQDYVQEVMDAVIMLMPMERESVKNMLETIAKAGKTVDVTVRVSLIEMMSDNYRKLLELLHMKRGGTK